VTISHNGLFLIMVDVDGHGIFMNLPRRVVLQRFNFKRTVHDIKFSPDDEMFAATHGRGAQLWKTPGGTHTFAPLTLKRTLAGHSDDVTCLSWSPDSQSIIMGGRDLSARVYYRVRSKHMSMTVLSGHRDRIVGAFFSKEGDEAFTVARDGGLFTWSFDSPVEADEAEDGQRRKAKWSLKEREFLWDPNTIVSAVDFSQQTGLMVVGFSNGVFGLYEMPGNVKLAQLSVSNQSLTSVTINSTGEWLALGCKDTHQMLVWEWKSETYVLKQQGHLHGLSVVDYSPDGVYVASGGEDGKVKLWNSKSGFCFATFSEHRAPVTGVKFSGTGASRVLLSSSLDGTVRAHDLLRYRCFRTLTSPEPAQFSCLAVDESGEVVCAGSMDPFNVYVWSLQTGQLVDMLCGHEGPVTSLAFAPGTAVLASGSWDGTLKMWDVYKNSCVDTMEHGCDVLALCFRPDGREICTATTNGSLVVWDAENGNQVTSIDGRRDIRGGRMTTEVTTAENSARSKYFTCVAYTADGQFLLAGGLSKYLCIYSVSAGTLVRKFQLSHNRSLEGTVDILRSDRLVDGIAIDATEIESDDEERPVQAGHSASARGANFGLRTVKPSIMSAAVSFSGSGREWAAATSQGLQIYGLDHVQFSPVALDEAVTPQAVYAQLQRQEYSKALNGALVMGSSERALLAVVMESVPASSLDLVVKSVHVPLLKDLLRFLADQIGKSAHVGWYLKWAWQVLLIHGPALQRETSEYMESFRALTRAVSAVQKDVLRMSDDSSYQLDFLLGQMADPGANVVRDAAGEIIIGPDTGTGAADEDGGVGEWFGPKPTATDADVDEDAVPDWAGMSSNWE
jgi:periodic tryptophan protein 2